VVVEVEVLVVDPHGAAEVERDVPDPLPEPGHEIELGFDQLEQLVQRGRRTLKMIVVAPCM
jgi:hypothetical protein